MDFNILGLIADQLSDEDKAKIVAGLAIERAVSNLEQHRLGTDLMSGPFCPHPFLVHTAYVERDGRPILCSAILEGDVANTGPVIAVFSVLPGDMVEPLVETEVEGDKPFTVLVRKAVGEMMDRAKEEIGIHVE